MEVNLTATQRICNERKTHLAIIVKSSEKRVQKQKSGGKRMEREKKKVMPPPEIAFYISVWRRQPVEEVAKEI